MTGQLALAALLATGCGAAQKPCTDSIDELEETRAATVVARCKHYPSIYACPKADGIDWKYRRRVEEMEMACR